MTVWNHANLSGMSKDRARALFKGNYVQTFLFGKIPFSLRTSVVLDIIRNGYKILFRETPLPYSIENRSSSSARRQDSFVEGAISELMSRGCLREVSDYPQFCNPLHVAVQSSGKLRLILDLSHLNKFVVKKSVKYEDLRTVLQLFSPGVFVFSFDLKSAYHHIDICEEHKKFLSFKWPSVDGAMKFYEFKVLPFGLTSAPYIFTKVTRQLVKFWRGCGILALMYLDDGIGGNLSRESAKNISVQVRKDLASAGFACNDEKSNWEPVQNLVFLVTVLDFETGLISIPEERILKLKSSIDSCLQDNFISTRGLASITGQIISMSCAVGNVTRLLTRNCYIMQQSNREPPGINFCSCPLRFATSFPFGKATLTPLMGSQCHQSLVLWRVTNVRACEPEPEPRAVFASHCVFFCFFFFFFKFNVNILLSKCYTWLKKQNFPIFFRALISAQVVFLSVSNLISSNGFRGSVYSFRYNLNLEFPSQIFVSK